MARFALALLAPLTFLTAQDPTKDWLVGPVDATAKIEEHGPLMGEPHAIHMSNGLTSRYFSLLKGNAACMRISDDTRRSMLLRAVRPEARVTLDGVPFDIGGLVGQPNQAYLGEDSFRKLKADPKAYRYVGHEISEPKERLAWKRVRHHAPGAQWPPKGKAIRFDYECPDERFKGVRVSVHYEIYDGIPAYCKWLTVHNGTERAIEIDRCTTEILAVVEHVNWVEHRDGVQQPHPQCLHVETDFAFGGMTWENANRHVVHWRPDPQFHTQVNYAKQNPCLLVVEPTHGPDVMLAKGKTFESYRTFELVMDGNDSRERRGLARRRLYRTVAPWITENPLILHVVSVDPKVVRAAIDQAAECGFEMVSLSFGSGLNMEDASEANHQKFGDLAAYAESKGIHLGGYSLLSSRRIKPDFDNCVNPETGEPGGQTHGFCPALASDWGQTYFRRLRAFYGNTEFLQFTHDGSYPGDLDASSRPPLQRGADDSRWVQWQIIRDFYQDLRAKGVYLRIPDYYYLSGTNECGMGYREVNWSLPRAQQVIHTRQNIFDGTWDKTPSMGWMFVPLTQYHGGGASATIEPLDDHIDHYRRMLRSNLALGVQAVYRGHRLYDTERVRDMVKEEVAWYSKYRRILEGDLIHGVRANGMDVDWMLHVDPTGPIPGMLVVFNPTTTSRVVRLRIDLYYTGIRKRARVALRDENPEYADLDGTVVEMNVTVPAQGMNWFTLR